MNPSILEPVDLPAGAVMTPFIDCYTSWHSLNRVASQAGELRWKIKAACFTLQHQQM
jgi:hypothetical protein